MKKLVIFGSIGIDDIKTPFGRQKNVLGGSAIYASICASYFASNFSIALVSAVGEDFPEKYFQTLKKKNIDISNLTKNGKTFRWQGEYKYDMNEAQTIKTCLNCLEAFNPNISEQHKNSEYVFLANNDPDLQLKVLKQFTLPKVVLIDTMNYWIDKKYTSLVKVINKSNILLLNEQEARQLYKTPNLIKAGHLALQMGPEFVIIKKGEHGSLLFSHRGFFSAPAYPLEDLVDPTGAGDSFAGSLIGYLAKTSDASESNIRRAIIYGSSIASFCTEDFSINKLTNISFKDIQERYNIFNKIREF